MIYTLRFFFTLQNAVCFTILTYLVPVLFTFYIQGVLKFKKKIIIQAPKGSRVLVLFVVRPFKLTDMSPVWFWIALWYLIV